MFDPWGGDVGGVWSQNVSQQRRQFTTYERDGNESDQAMMRHYNRYWSRFYQPDFYDGAYDFGDPQSFNRYAYVQNDPINFVDPLGLDDCIGTCVDVNGEEFPCDICPDRQIESVDTWSWGYFLPAI